MQPVVTEAGQTAADKICYAPSAKLLVVFAAALSTVAVSLEAALIAAHTPYVHAPFGALMAAAMVRVTADLPRAFLPK